MSKRKMTKRSTKHAHTFKTKDRVTRTPMKTGVNSGAPEGCVEVVTHDFEVPSSQLLVTH
jgi:hypothetical protein